MARDCSPRCSLIRARFPIPKASSCQMSLKAHVDAAGPLVELLLGPMPKIPAWINSSGVWKPLIRMLGRSMRPFSRRIRAATAWTSA